MSYDSTSNSLRGIEQGWQIWLVKKQTFSDSDSSSFTSGAKQGQPRWQLPGTLLPQDDTKTREDNATRGVGHPDTEESVLCSLIAGGCTLRRGTSYLIRTQEVMRKCLPGRWGGSFLSSHVLGGPQGVLPSFRSAVVKSCLHGPCRDAHGRQGNREETLPFQS